MKSLLSLSLALSMGLFAAHPVTAQSSFARTFPPPPPPPPPPPHLPPVIVTPPSSAPPTTVTPPPTTTVVQPPLPPDPRFINPFPNPMDVTRTFSTPNQINTNALFGAEALAGIQESKAFPSVEDLKGKTDFILVQGPENSFKRESPYLVNLLTGTVLVSVKRPSTLGMMNTAYGEISFNANSDAFVQFDNGVLRLRNIDGLGQNVRVHLDRGPFAAPHDKIFALAPGYEFVVSDHKLTRNELRPEDGLLRRKSQVIADGFGGISQFHVDTALQQSSLVSAMAQNASDAKNKRVLSDMSRMGAVLNHLNGVDGYSPE